MTRARLAFWLLVLGVSFPACGSSWKWRRREEQSAGRRESGGEVRRAFRRRGPIQRPIPIRAGRIRSILPAVGEMTQTYGKNAPFARPAFAVSTAYIVIKMA